jgi:hypothetical protein
MGANDYDCYGEYITERCKGCPSTIECILISILSELKKTRNKEEKSYFKGVSKLFNKDTIDTQHNAREQYFDKRIKENSLYILELEKEKNTSVDIKVKLEIEDEIERLQDEIKKYEKIKQEENEL